MERPKPNCDEHKKDEESKAASPVREDAVGDSGQRRSPLRHRSPTTLTVTRTKGGHRSTACTKHAGTENSRIQNQEEAKHHGQETAVRVALHLAQLATKKKDSDWLHTAPGTALAYLT